MNIIDLLKDMTGTFINISIKKFKKTKEKHGSL